MLNDVVSTGNTLVGRMISGIVAMSLDHPVALTCILATLIGASVAVLHDVVRPRSETVRQS
ncbi:hypothetical protein D3273_25315 [Lichenibacterium minor]|uniref:Uncharacterized protein n=1 Tax=Lichenibacterium minor TaxID=2316528 RepID=A0A4Q2U2U8_9HYPH|nr:hypothetical protein [Lichenibacterium minor]RYC29187.1 hypothetical protein D3273_25315 [Lichenibacterium minor]